MTMSHSAAVYSLFVCLYSYAKYYYCSTSKYITISAAGKLVRTTFCILYLVHRWSLFSAVNTRILDTAAVYTYDKSKVQQRQNILVTSSKSTAV